jgi:uncharacterized protein YlzI (FlbEa/FlbD family)
MRCVELTRRADGITVHVNPAHIVMICPRASDPDSPAAVSLATGEKLDVAETPEEVLQRIAELDRAAPHAAGGW